MLVFATGDLVTAELERFAREHELRGAHFTGIGALQEVVLRYFDWESKQYEDIPVAAQVEVLALSGNIAIADGAPRIHAHLVVGFRDGSTRGGHLKEGRVRPTLELIVTESPEHLHRTFDEESGLALLDIQARVL